MTLEFGIVFGGFAIGALLLNLVFVAVAVIAIDVGRAYWHKRQARPFVAKKATEGGRGKFWVGIYDNGKRILQTAPPGHETEQEAIDVIEHLNKHGLVMEDSDA